MHKTLGTLLAVGTAIGVVLAGCPVAEAVSARQSIRVSIVIPERPLAYYLETGTTPPQELLARQAQETALAQAEPTLQGYQPAAEPVVQQREQSSTDMVVLPVGGVVIRHTRVTDFL